MAEASLFCRVVMSGDTVEVYQYKYPVKVGYERKFDVIRSENTNSSDGKRYDNLLRARQNVRRLIWCNQGPYTKFLTLTYAEACLDRKKVIRDVTTFVQAMRRLGYDMKYLYVLEHQKERGEKEGNVGSLHIHMVVFVDRFIPVDDIRRCWKHGIFDIKKIEFVRNLAAYVCKYITKETIADFGCHCFACSKGLKRPVEECFYSEGYSDHTYNGLHPKDVIDALKVGFHSQMRHDFLDADGVGRSQVVNYWQGSFRDINPIEEAKDYIEL